MTTNEFDQYHLERPEIFDALKRFALEAKSSGRTRIGIKMLLERVRWYTAIERRGEFRVNNTAAPFYSRLLMQECPELEGFFELRPSAADQRGLL